MTMGKHPPASAICKNIMCQKPIYIANDEQWYHADSMNRFCKVGDPSNVAVPLENAGLKTA